MQKFKTPSIENRHQAYLQAKLELDQSGNKYGVEAINVTDQIKMKPISSVADHPLTGNHDAPLIHMSSLSESPDLQMECEECEDEEQIQMKSGTHPLMMAGADDEEDEDSTITTIQPKLQIGEPGDKYEQEADSVADRVMRMNDPDAMQMQAIEEEEDSIQMQPVKEEEESLQMKPVIQKSTNGDQNASNDISQKLNSTKGSGEKLPNKVGAEMGRKMGADFCTTKIHTDSQAINMNKELGAQAFTHGNDIYFNQGNYAPGSSKGKHLLAHELTHVVQQGALQSKSCENKCQFELNRMPNMFGSNVPISNAITHISPIIQCIPKDAKVDAYSKFLRTNSRIEGKPDSKKKALAMVQDQIDDTGHYWLPDTLMYLLIQELMTGTTTAIERTGILEALERMSGSMLTNTFQKINVNSLVAHYSGKELTRLKDFFTRRFKGGLANVKAGQIKTKGKYVHSGVPLSSLDVIKKTITWLKSNKRTCSALFNDAWNASKAVALGEMHYDNVQRQFAADMLTLKGGVNVGLALEIPVAQQNEVDYYVKHSRLPKGAKGWWKNDKLFKGIMNAARATKTQVIAMDIKTGASRDPHMASKVQQLLKSKSKVMIYVGAMHAKEGVKSSLGGILNAALGAGIYTIDMFYPGKSENIYWMIKDAFPSDKSIGFDIDKSPLKSHPDKDYVKITLGRNNDGYIYFHNATSYK